MGRAAVRLERPLTVGRLFGARRLSLNAGEHVVEIRREAGTYSLRVGEHVATIAPAFRMGRVRRDFEAATRTHDRDDVRRLLKHLMEG